MGVMSTEIYDARKRFFNESAENWIDTYYSDPENTKQNKYEKDFKRLFSLLPLKPGHCVLDVGCGTGVLVPYILEVIGKNGFLYELDFAERMIEINRRIHMEENIRFIVSDVEHAPLPGKSCDIAVCFSCFPHFHDKQKAINTLGRTLKRRGILIIAHLDSSKAINEYHYRSHKAVKHDRLPSEDAMRIMLKEGGFDTLRFIDEERFYYIQAQLV